MNVDRFISEQRAEWPMAERNFAALDGVEVRAVSMPGIDFKVQFNPARIVSSGAKVDAKSLAARPCFLCEANRPAEQRGLEWRDYTVLINPFPIFPRHLTIPARSHTPQRIAGRVPDMMALAAELDGYTVFYNGPRCGASAPDHMHFQAGNSDFLPLWDAMKAAPLQPVADDGQGTMLSACTSLPMGLFVIDAANPEAAGRMFDRLYAALPEGEEEPMMNLLAAGSRLVVIPRKRHRPSFYGTEGDDCMLLSPASVDMGGAFITPRRADFDRMDAEVLGRVFAELCLAPEDINVISQKVSEK